MNIKNPKIKFKFIFVAFMLWCFLLNIQFVNINLVIPKRFFRLRIWYRFYRQIAVNDDKSSSHHRYHSLSQIQFSDQELIKKCFTLVLCQHSWSKSIIDKFCLTWLVLKYFILKSHRFIQGFAHQSRSMEQAVRESRIPLTPGMKPTFSMLDQNCRIWMLATTDAHSFKGATVMLVTYRL